MLVQRYRVIAPGSATPKTVLPVLRGLTDEMRAALGDDVSLPCIVEQYPDLDRTATPDACGGLPVVRRYRLVDSEVKRWRKPARGAPT